MSRKLVAYLQNLENTSPNLKEDVQKILLRLSAQGKVASRRSLEKRVEELAEETGLDLKVYYHANSKGGTVRILEGRKEYAVLNSTDIYLTRSERSEAHEEQYYVGIPRPTRGGKSLSRSSSYAGDCLEDFRELKTKYPGIQNLWSVGHALVHSKLRGKGLGTLMYEALLELGVSQKAALAPGMCFGEDTSPSALRVWNSLIRRYPHVGYVTWGK